MKTISIETESACVDLARFSGEIHAMIHVSDPLLPARRQFQAITDAIHALCRACPDASPVFMRWFLSDIANQDGLIPSLPFPVAVSVVGQAPLDGTKCALWVYMLDNAAVRTLPAGFIAASMPCGVTQLWQAANTGISTRAILGDYAHDLASVGLTLEANCLRTWFIVHDVDRNYRDVVDGRNEVFALNGLTRDTHFIASTGIGGDNPVPGATVTMDAVALQGLARDAVSYLSAPEHLNPTHEYGVAFERATAVEYPDRRHVVVSGTASIDNKGRVMHPGDILAQCSRMLENIGALLEAGSAGWTDVMQAIVYLRDPSDFTLVSKYLAETLPFSFPYVIVHAPVCRPGWLVEMECIAALPL